MQETLKMKLNFIFLFFILLNSISCVPVALEEGEEDEVSILFQDAREKYGKKKNTIEANRQLRIGDRFYVESVLKDIFGESIITAQGDQAYQLIYRRQGTFGGGCDFYSNNIEETGAGSGNYKTPDKRLNCFESPYNNSQVGQSTIVRAGYMVKFCEFTIERNPAAVGHAYDKVDIDPSSTAINMKNFSKLHKLFYPLETPNQKFSSLLKELNNDQDKKEAWDTILLSLCVSPDWQIP